MSTLQQTGIYNTLGQIAYKLTLPLMRPLIRRTVRVYVLLEHNGEILLIKNCFGRQNWSLPGGGKKSSENLYQAAAREVKEEVGVLLSLRELQKITQGTWRTDRLNFRYSILAVRLKSKPEISIKKMEVVEARWQPRNESKIPLPPEIQQAVSLLYKSAARKSR